MSDNNINNYINNDFDNVVGVNTIENAQREVQMDTLNTNTELNVQTNNTFFSKTNTFDKMNELKMQINNEFGINAILTSSKSKNTGNTGNTNIKIDDKYQEGNIDIPSKISELFKELNEMEIKANNAISSLQKNKKDIPSHVPEPTLNTKNFYEFKLNIMVRNKLNDETKVLHDQHELLQNHTSLVRMIKNPKNLISEKTKTCMDRILSNGYVDKEKEIKQPPHISSTNTGVQKSNKVKIADKKVSAALTAYKMSPSRNKDSFDILSYKTTQNNIIDNKKNEILDILNKKELNNKDSNSNNNASNANNFTNISGLNLLNHLKLNKTNGASKPTNRSTCSKKVNNSYYSEDCFKKFSLEDDNIMNKIKGIIPEITKDRNYEGSRKHDISHTDKTDKVRRLDDKFNRMFNHN